MKALSLTQPWASLVALGHKHYETRGWQTTYRGALAIHATANLRPVGGRAGLVEIVQAAPFYRALGAGKVDDIVEYLLARQGKVLAVCNLVAVLRTDRARDLARELDLPDFAPHEKQFGDFTPGRYAWALANVHELTTPVDARGEPGLWEWRERSAA